jgi:hypothetical protein
MGFPLDVRSVVLLKKTRRMERDRGGGSIEVKEQEEKEFPLIAGIIGYIFIIVLLVLLMFFPVKAGGVEGIREIDWLKVYGNVGAYMETEGKGKYFRRHIDEVEFYLTDHGYWSLYVIAVIESSLRSDVNTKVGDYTVFQINKRFWKLDELSGITQMESVEVEDVEANPSYFAAHIFVYNVFEALRSRGLGDLCEVITAYHRPYKLSKPYYRKVVSNYKGCMDVRYVGYRID